MTAEYEMESHVPDADPCTKCGKESHRHRIRHAFLPNRFQADWCASCGWHEDMHYVSKTKRVYPDHVPQGESHCEKCGYRSDQHRVTHKVDGDPCSKCGLKASQHKKYRTNGQKRTYIGIDGEGQGRADHRYILLAAKRESLPNKKNEEWYVEAEEGGRLTTVQCLDLILGLPNTNTLIFSYSFNYDLTKMLTDLDNESLYLLFRPDLRQRSGDEAMKGPYPVKWNGYRLNLQGTKFSVRKGNRYNKIWDLFKFFQGKFVGALKDWKIGSPDLLERMSKMKDKRSEFDKEGMKAIRDYCLEECQCIAELGHKLVAAHEQAGLKLKTFYGAGSSGAAMLTVMGIKKYLVPTPVAMKSAVAAAFFGGRFENSVIGSINEPLFNYDISSAYPYHTTFLPCLLHGTWKRTEKRSDIDDARAALVSYELGNNPCISTWGPFPFRTADGSISFPIESGGGWVWKDEYISGERIFPHVKFKEAWVYHTDCDCQPFAKLPEYYLVRLRIGKEGAGIVIKLAVNSCYGKLAQSVGSAQFNCWIWAGMITSGCRAQILDMLALHKDWSNLLMIATDGIYTRERLETPKPFNTGTDIEIDGKRKPLGGWEETAHPNGVFIARPGIYFPISPTKEEIKKIRARGVGRSVVLEHWKVIVEAWERDGVNAIARVPDVTRFCGAKTSIMKVPQGYARALPGRKNKDGGTLPAYGQWISRKNELSFNPLPKREAVNPDGLTLQLRKFPKTQRSVPYDKASKSRETIELARATLEAMEQPDADLTEYEEGNET